MNNNKFSFKDGLVHRLRSQFGYGLSQTPQGYLLATRRNIGPFGGLSVFCIGNADGQTETLQSITNFINSTYDLGEEELRRVAKMSPVRSRVYFSVLVSESHFPEDLISILKDTHENRNIFAYEIPVLVEAQPFKITKIFPWQFSGMGLFPVFWLHLRSVLKDTPISAR